MKLIDESNILHFLLAGGKFIYAGTNYANYTSSHILNAIHFPASTLRNSSLYPNTVRGANAIVPVQPIDEESIKKLFRDARLSTQDKICVYAEPDSDLLDAFYVIYVLQAFGFRNVSYLNTEFRKLDPQFLTQDYPIWVPVLCEDYSFTDITIQAQEFALLNKLGAITPLDVRPPNAFAGLEKRFKVNGHAPNAVNIFWKRFFVPVTTSPLVVSNRLKPLPEIEQILAENGFTSETNTVLTCNTGSEITSDAFVLIDLLGWKKTRLFAGSWNVYQYLHQVDPEQFPVVKGN
jgi:3-mercaptopyruvate sulfurtransferase SseA